MQLLRIAIMLAALPAAFAAAVAECRFGGNKCDSTNSTVMLCDTHGWKPIETCYKVGACHVGPAGNAYCDKAVECTPYETKCDASNYASKMCNQYGFWETVRKCAKPGCCEIRNGTAACKVACGVGLEPPAARAVHDVPKVGGYCEATGERYCDEGHGCILKCGANHAFFQEQCCGRKKCYYDNASLEPYCA
ncbi:hypothetical protein OPT61_g10561 [Boeremia exigua]|uniref:Uncharacterized protein n=1 Tax=Boeremia exigua TaxID=749465 RepID=A0ACC2HP01_9PLEO|nr:hypothetical protein OPT61_g10561 [Boeremia exigua]